jgi:hypothetical protein
MLHALDLKIRQMHEALNDLVNSDLTNLKVEHVALPGGYYHYVDFNEGQSEAQLANTASSLTANIASIKDHLKVWCTKSGATFEGNKLIASNQDVAIIYDLWNVNKHGVLNRPPRSGHMPRLENLRQSLGVSTGTSPGAFSVFTMDPKTGAIKTEAGGGGTITLSIDARVVDENGTLLGSFASMCERAATAWEKVLEAAGVSLPARPREG